MNKIRCQCCGKELPSGSMKYVIEIKSFADFDGCLEEYQGDIEDGILDILEDISDTDAKTQTEDVYQEMVFILCKECRTRFIKDPFCAEKETFDNEHVRGTVH